MPKKTLASAAAHAPEAQRKELREAIEYSKGRASTGDIRSTQVGQDRASRKRFESNYDAIFGKKEPPHGV